jgi:hypothetical protein
MAQLWLWRPIINVYLLWRMNTFNGRKRHSFSVIAWGERKRVQCLSKLQASLSKKKTRTRLASTFFISVEKAQWRVYVDILRFSVQLWTKLLLTIARSNTITRHSAMYVHSGSKWCIMKILSRNQSVTGLL